jgi:hypothetical protein
VIAASIVEENGKSFTDAQGDVFRGLEVAVSRLRVDMLDFQFFMFASKICRSLNTRRALAR